ncbi:MAG: primosomal protein N' [Clostridiales bacterium]|nr:primosomal protein N' [Clostridiales bacterium]
MYAKVIVDISNNELDRIFDYSVGELSLEPGCRVTVPFGIRQIEGYVIDLNDTTDCPIDKIKPITARLDDYPVITSEMLSLMRFMCDRYHLRVIDALRLFIPAQMRGGKVKELSKKFVSVNPDIDDPRSLIKPSAVMQLAALEFVLERGEVSLSEVNANCSAASVRNLIMRDILRIKDVEVMRTPYNNLTVNDNNVRLTSDQQAVVDTVLSATNKTFLLHGVTGSGKTEVYMHCIAKVLASGKTAIMLVPEISLTPQVLSSFRARFGSRVALLHSGLSVGERFDEWRRLITGEAVVAVGARSAVFAPLKNVGIIIIDEEHDGSYTSESNPRYVTSEVAEFRKRYNECNIILGSATPSIESYHKAMTGEYQLLELANRINKRPLPEISIINMCNEVYNGNNGAFSVKLEDELHKCIESNNQAIIFINRRGYSSYVMCRSCGYVAKCEQCDVSLVYHKEEDTLKCHYCGNRYKALSVCPNCGSEHIKRGYVGTEQIAEKLKEMFPNETILRMDNDTTQNKNAHLQILGDFASKKAKILVGTQMIAKGHDFPDVTLVGIIDADMSLHFADYRSVERTYQLITQVAGRAGRDKKAGTVVLQTYSPNHYVYKFAVSGDYKHFYEKECNLREVTKFPPFTRIVRILVSGESEIAVRDALQAIFEKVKAIAQNDKRFVFLNYMWAPVKLIKNMRRAQILMRILPDFDGYSEIYKIADEYKTNKINIFVETNPNSLS